MRMGIFAILVAMAAGNAVAMPRFAHWSASERLDWVAAPEAARYELRGADLRVALRKDSSGSFHVPPLKLEDWISEPLLVVALGTKGQELGRARLELHGLLDERFFWDGALGVTWPDSKPSFALWAPTAQNVNLLQFDDEEHLTRIVPMKNQNGVWRAQGIPGRYLYEVTVFQPETEQVETHRVTDPWSVALTWDSRFSLAVRLDESVPPGWEDFRPPHREPTTIWESHVRDLTVGDPLLPVALQGKFSGVGHQQSRNQSHLRELAEAGVTHLHLLPINDFGSVPERNAVIPRFPSSGRSSAAPQEELDRVRKLDAYNWGYDPVHWMVPEGSYSLENRVRELREMVLRLGSMGIGLVQDVVFNHTFASGSEPFSVLDRVVPMYFYRFKANGTRYESSCCPDTASERKMMEKLITDSLLHWARTYRVAGFRFDLMNLHPKDMMDRVRHRLREEFPHILLYGEAWPFGSLEDSYPGKAFFQTRSYGTGVASFNDRLRDAIRGGNTSPSGKSDQGWATGLYWDFNHEPANRDTPPWPSAQQERLGFYSDVIRFGIAGNLRDYNLRDFLGNSVTGGSHFFRGQETAWAASPRETVNYVSAHDGYTLFDSIVAKVPFTTPRKTDPARAQILALATVALSQGIAFFEGGSELLRSKSGDADSYDSGDWFNRIDFSFASNNWAVGLPPHWRNLSDWSFWKPRLDSGMFGATTDEILKAKDLFLAYLRIRSESDHFRLSTLEEVETQLRFLSNDAGLTPGLIVYWIQGTEGDRLIALNPAPEAQTFLSPILQAKTWRLHPELRKFVDDPSIRKARLEVPPQTALVLVEGKR